MRLKTMNPFSSAESALRLCETVSILAGAIAVAALFGQIAAGRIVNRRQAEKILELERGNIDAGRQLETERRERLELEKAVSHRRLTGTQKESLSRLLTASPGKVVIVSLTLDIESSDFADDFDAALRGAGWTTERKKTGLSAEYGVSIGMREGTNLEIAKRLSDALTSIGVPHRNKVFSDIEAGVSYLLIENKPPITPKDAK